MPWSLSCNHHALVGFFGLTLRLQQQRLINSSRPPMFTFERASDAGRECAKNRHSLSLSLYVALS
jgi:hypothetical protein